MWFCYNCPHFQIGPEILRGVREVLTLAPGQTGVVLAARDGFEKGLKPKSTEIKWSSSFICSYPRQIQLL
jgi:hypothetical protein